MPFIFITLSLFLLPILTLVLLIFKLLPLDRLDITLLVTIILYCFLAAVPLKLVLSTLPFLIALLILFKRGFLMPILIYLIIIG